MDAVASQVLSIRAMELSDIDAIAPWFADPDDLSLFERSTPLPPGREQLRASWKDDLTAGVSPAKAYWYIACDTAGAAVAIGGLQSIEYVNGNCVMPVFVAKAMRGKGLGIRLTGLLLDLAFDKLRLTRVTTYYREDNEISAKLIARAAFKIEGIMRQSWFCNGSHFNMIMAGILCDEWALRRVSLNDELDDSMMLRLG